MSSLILPRRLRRQPNGYLSLAERWTAKQPALLHYPWLDPLLNYAGGPRATKTIMPAQRMAGEGIVFSAPDATRAISYPNLEFSGTQPITVLAIVDSVPELGFAGALLGVGTEIVLRATASGGVEFILNSFATNDRASVGSSTTKRGDHQVIGGSYGSSGKLRAAYNGNFSEVTPTGSYTNPGSSTQLYSPEGLNYYSGGVYAVAVFRSEFSTQDWIDLVENPWALYKDKPRPVYFSAATGGPVTGTLTATEAQDSAAIVGNVLITCTLSATEAQDNASFTGSVISTITGTLAATEAQDNASFAGNVYITGTLAATEPQDSAVFSGPVAVSEQTPNRAGGVYTSRKRQKIVLLERVEDVEDFVEQIEQAVKEAPKAKPVLRKVKKLRPQTVENTYDNAQAWVDYYQRMAEALRDREQAAQLQADLERGAKMLESVLAMRETQELLRIAKRREDEELILMLMAA